MWENPFVILFFYVSLLLAPSPIKAFVLPLTYVTLHVLHGKWILHVCFSLYEWITGSLFYILFGHFKFVQHIVKSHQKGLTASFDYDSCNVFSTSFSWYHVEMKRLYMGKLAPIIFIKLQSGECSFTVLRLCSLDLQTSPSWILIIAFEVFCCKTWQVW